jgi:hypothetical protein
MPRLANVISLESEEGEAELRKLRATKEGDTIKSPSLRHFDAPLLWKCLSSSPGKTWVFDGFLFDIFVMRVTVTNTGKELKYMVGGR